MSANALLSLDRLSAGYGRSVVVADVSFVLNQGSFTGLLGSNGAGKSTLLKTLLGILPSLGGIFSWSEHGGKVPVVGYVPQRDSLDSIYLFSGREVAEMGVCARVKAGRGVPAKERERVTECLKDVDALGFCDQRFAHLSGGQKQRILIARALATNPDMLVLDEPTAGVDAAASRAIVDLLKRLHQNGLTILMVNHDLPVVRELAQQVVWLANGKANFGPVNELLNAERMMGLLAGSH
jgi:ABC-type Mn2+/Zn2+ transport system ATPase subunit